MRRTAWLLVVVAAVLAVGCTTAVVGDWTLLGERVVNDRVDRDTIPVGASAGQLSALKIRALRRPVHILDVKVVFANGRVQDLALRRVIPPGGESRAIDLVGSERTVSRVELTYEAESRGRGRRATVQLYGRP